jgi:hypothetical protein
MVFGVVLFACTTSAGAQTYLDATGKPILPCRGAGCVESARAVARKVRGESHDANPDSLRMAMYAVATFRDATLFQTLLAMAADTSGTPESRVYSVIAAHRMLHPSHWLRYEVITLPARADGGLPCEASHEDASDAGPSAEGDPLPADATVQWHDLLRRLEGDSNAPMMVRNAATCAET